MTKLSTSYLSLALKNPIVVGASSMSADIDMLKKLEKAGAAAIVFKTLFEEQINLESALLDEQLEQSGGLHAESTSLYPKLQHAGPTAHLVKLKKAKENLSIPVIASLNCLTAETWLEYALLIEQTGVDALELNFYFTPGNADIQGSSIEDKQVELIQVLKKKVKIPVSVKLSMFYSNPLNFIKKLESAGVDGIVIFNRMFEPDINLQTVKHAAPFYMSNQGDYRLALRYAGLLFGQTNASVCCNTGIYEGNDVVKMILAGADCVQIVSTLYKNKPEYITTILQDIEAFMDKNGFGNITELKGLLSKSNTKDPFVYKRGQYIDLILSSDLLLK